jgi:hypothetical protein
MPVRPSPSVGALASSSHDPNWRKVVGAGIPGADEVDEDEIVLVVLGRFGRPLPCADASRSAAN